MSATDADTSTPLVSSDYQGQDHASGCCAQHNRSVNVVFGLEALPITLSQDVPPPEDRDLIEDAVLLSKGIEAERGPDRIAGLVSSNGRIARAFLEAAIPHLNTDTPTFCEWGSGVGIVTCLARRLGWAARGVDIEPRLVKTASALAASHDIDVSFHEGSYKPAGLFDLDTAVEDFRTEHGLELFDFDVIYAYLWPAEAHAVTTAIAKHAHEGTIFLRYGGGITCDAFRVNREGVAAGT